MVLTLTVHRMNQVYQAHQTGLQEHLMCLPAKTEKKQIETYYLFFFTAICWQPHYDELSQFGSKL